MSQFYFAWVNSTDIVFSAAFEREDLKVISFELTQSEGSAGQFPSLKVVVQNPRIGLLNPGRKQWLWFSLADASTDGAKPLFFGRLVGLPTDPEGDRVTLDFVAKPVDYDGQKLALFTSLGTPPVYDPVFVASSDRSNPDSLLAAMPAAWHIDRLTHVVSLSDLITGEDGTVDFSGNFLRDSLSIDFGQTPGRTVHLEASVSWDQTATGLIDISARAVAAAKAAGSVNDGVIETYTGEGLAKAWPKNGDNIGGDWQFGPCAVVRGDYKWIPTPDNEIVQVTGPASYVIIPLWSFRPVLKVRYDTSRSRTEKLTFDLTADVQALLTDPGSDEALSVSLSSSDVASPIDPPFATDGDGLKPIGNPRNRSYFLTARGRQSVEYLIRLARAQLLSRARTVTVKFSVPFADGLDLTCRQNASISDPRLPGGQAAGKIIEYSLTADGDSGVLGCTVSVGCTIGNGNTVSASAGTGDWCSDAWVGDGWQTRTGEVIMPIAGEVTYNAYGHTAIHDDGVDFARMTPARVIQSFTMIDGKTVQKAVIEAYQGEAATAQTIIDGLNQVFSEFDLRLVPLNTGPFETDFALTVSRLMVPKTIDLAAGSTA